MNAVECETLTKQFGSTRAVHNLTLSLPPHRITGIIGRNGAGKTTLLKLMAGYLRPTSGTLHVFSMNPFNNLQTSANMIFVDDYMTMPPSLTLSETLDGVAGFYENWNRKLAFGLFEYFNLNPKQYHVNLSKGMKSTFNVILGIAARCPLTIFDEPTVGMDAAVRKDFYRALLKDFMKFPRTILLSSHLLNEINDILNDIVLIHEGNKFFHMPMDEVKEYAVGLQGPEQAIAGVVDDSKILYRKMLGHQKVYAVVPNEFDGEGLAKIRQKGVEVTGVAPDDLCVYLTAKHKGGIDDVFDRS